VTFGGEEASPESLLRLAAKQAFLNKDNTIVIDGTNEAVILLLIITTIKD